ncbi:MAG: hypothetical protein ABR591_10955, partial [Candidatus Velthaea sp.]
MRRCRTLPLGIDAGATRVRAALVETDSSGRPSLVAVATRERTGELHADVAAAVGELATSERRCVLAVAAPHADLRAMIFPRMNRHEQDKAARFEACRYLGDSAAEAIVRVAPTDADGISVVGTVPRPVLHDLTSAARQAKLCPIAVDHAGLALRRALPQASVIGDLGHNGLVVYAPASHVPSIRYASIGGKDFTHASA